MRSTLFLLFASLVTTQTVQADPLFSAPAGDLLKAPLSSSTPGRETVIKALSIARGDRVRLSIPLNGVQFKVPAAAGKAEIRHDVIVSRPDGTTYIRDSLSPAQRQELASVAVERNLTITKEVVHVTVPSAKRKQIRKVISTLLKEGQTVAHLTRTPKKPWFGTPAKTSVLTTAVAFLGAVSDLSANFYDYLRSGLNPTEARASDRIDRTISTAPGPSAAAHGSATAAGR